MSALKIVSGLLLTCMHLMFMIVFNVCIVGKYKEMLLFIMSFSIFYVCHKNLFYASHPSYPVLIGQVIHCSFIAFALFFKWNLVHFVMMYNNISLYLLFNYVCITYVILIFFILLVNDYKN